MDLIVGATSNLAMAIQDASLEKILTVSRKTYQTWSGKDGSERIRKFFEERDEKLSNVYVTTGITDPLLTKDVIQTINVDLPVQIAKVASQFGIRTYTFGTVAETFAGSPNVYVASKIELSNEILKNGNFDGFARHIRLHTLFGGKNLKRHMFLGQIITSILHNKEFNMSSGNQIREYHHIDDVAKIILHLNHSDILENTHISHGKPLRLIDLATRIFHEYGDIKNLRIGKVPIRDAENFDFRFSPYPLEATSSIRCSIEEVEKYVEVCIKHGREVK